MKRDNTLAVLEKFISLLNIPIENQSIEDELLMHPEYPSLLAISDVLMTLKISNKALRVNIDDLRNVQCPFIIHSYLNNGDFLIVNNIVHETVFVSSEKWNRHKLSLTEFKKISTGVILTTDFEAKISLAKSFQTILFNFKFPLTIICLLLILIATVIYHTDYLASLNWQIVLLTFLKGIGLTTSLLLLIQAIDRDNPWVQKVCKSGGKTDCDAILSSNAAKIFNGLTWSEAGFFYFSATWILLLFAGGQRAIIQALTILNLISLPYTLYSIYYQARVAKQWCIMCCAVQAVLWLEFIPLINMGPFSSNGNWTIITGSTLFIAITTPIMLWILLKPMLVKVQRLSVLKQQLHKFKYNGELFNEKLISSLKVTQPSEEWSIVLGNAKADNIITLVTNPYCNPCAKTHKLLDELLTQKSNLQARIVFATENTNGDIKTQISRHLMSLNNLPNKSIIKKGLHDWYMQKQKNYNSWAKDYPVQINENEYDKLEKQRAWCQMAEVNTTPTLLVNGYLLPDLYELSDLKYMIE